MIPICIGFKFERLAEKVRFPSYALAWEGNCQLARFLRILQQ